MAGHTDTLELLQELTETPALSGREDLLISKMEAYFSDNSDRVEVDRLGNVTAWFPGREPGPSLLIFAHMDELGLIIRKIDQDGFLRFERVGGVPEKSLLNQWVDVHTRQGDVIPGIIGTTSHHVTPAERKFAVPSRLDMYIDLGCQSDEEVRALGVQVGDSVTYRATLNQLAGDRIGAKSLDNRIGCAMLVQTAEALAADPPASTVYLVASVQEEFNVRGVWPAVRKADPDAAICLDITIACDTPELRHLSDVSIGEGPVIGAYQFHGRGTLGGLIPNPGLRQFLHEVADGESLQVQEEVLIGIITDASFSQLLGQEGVAMASLAVPVRYTHAPVELCSLGDVDTSTRLLIKAAQKFDGSVHLARG